MPLTRAKTDRAVNFVKRNCNKLKSIVGGFKKSRHNLRGQARPPANKYDLANKPVVIKHQSGSKT